MFGARLVENKQTLQAAIAASGEIASFESAFETPLSSLILNIEPVQSGEGDPSPSNVRPIRGWKEARIARSNKNLIRFEEIDTTSNGVRFVSDPTTGAVHVSGTATASAFANLGIVTGKRVYPMTRIYIGGGSADVGVRLCYTTYDSTSTQTATTNKNKDKPSAYLFSDNTRTSWIRLVVSNGVTVDETIYPTVYLDNSTDFVKGEYTYRNVAWEDTAGTVYGGTLDVVKGKLIVNRKNILLSSLTWQRRTIRTFSASLDAGSYANATAPISEHLCDYFPTAYAKSYAGVEALHLGIYKTSGAVMSSTVYLKLTSEEISDSTAEFNQWLIDNPVHLCYVLNTPIEYQLTPTEITTLIGINNAWADTGDIQSLLVDPITGKLKFKLIQ